MVDKGVPEAHPTAQAMHDADFSPAEKRTRDARKLRWYERQYGAGFVSGFWVGIVAGFPLAAGVAAVSKWFSEWLFTF